MTPSSASSSSAYAFKPGGSLKFKGGDTSSSHTKKKKKKSRSSTSDSIRKGQQTSDTALVDNDRDIYPDESLKRGENNRGDENNDKEDDQEERIIGPIMTEAERKFDMIRKQRMAERVIKQAKLSHKDRVDAFNRDLESRTEHFEMKRVGGGG